MSENQCNFSSVKRAIRFGVILFSLLALLAACGSTTDTTTGSAATATVAPTATSSSTTGPGGGYGYGRGYGNGGTGAATPAPTTAPTGPTQAVSMVSPGGYSFAFSPATLTISVGTTVIWTNRTATPHTVTSDDGTSFNSTMNDPIEPSASFTFKFTKPGTYAYHCALHPTMTATIIVK